MAIRTVAGNLDHEFWTLLHHVDPLTGSLNPADVAHGLSHIPQIHYVGLKDKIMPVSVANKYMERSSTDGRIKIVLVDAGHQSGWEERWKDLLRMSAPE